MGSAAVEKEFSRLLATGWPVRTERPRPSLGGLTLLLAMHQMTMAAQLVNSSVPETREFWRAKCPELVKENDRG